MVDFSSILIRLSILHGVTSFLPKPARIHSSSLLLEAKTPGDGGFLRNETVVTKDMFLRESLKHESDETEQQTASVRRKGKGKKGYTVLDNRDILPFSVSVTTPDPYTHPDIKEEEARRRSKAPRRRHNAVEAGISSSLYIGASVDKDGGSTNKQKRNKKKSASNNEVDTSTWLGDYVLDRLTTTGDVLEVDGRQFKVVRHKCQYKYAGGKKFVMARKILQVKEISRLQTEQQLESQLKMASDAIPPEEA